MKRSFLILLSILAFQTVECFRQHAPIHPPPPPPPRRDSSDSSSLSSESVSSEEDVVEIQNQNQRKRIDPDRLIQLQQQQEEERAAQNPMEERRNKFFERPSSEELEAYDDKVRSQKNNRIIEEEPVLMQGAMDPVRGPKPMKPKMDDTDEKLFLAALGQIYLEKLDDESRAIEKFPGPPGPIGPMGPPPPVDYDYFFVPYETPGKKEANNNGNNNVHVNVNHVQVNSNVLHVPEKDKKKDAEPQAMPPIVPSYHYSEPISTSKYLYFNFNMVDCAILFVLVAVFLFATKKAYKKCFPKKTVAPQLPTTLPPTYSPSALVVETVSKKTPQ